MRTAATLLAIVMCLAGARPASAQTNKTWDLSGAYAYIRDSTQDLGLPIGWSAGGSVHLNQWLSIVADGGGNYKIVPLIGSDVRISLHSVMAGARASLAVGHLVEFVQIVFGPVHARGTAFGLSSSDTHFAGQGGIGLDVPLKGRLAARIQFDMRVLETAHEFRTVVGIAYNAR